MDEVFKKIYETVLELKSIRRIPQLLFISSVVPEATGLVRDVILDFKKLNPDIKEIDFIIQSSGGSPDDAYRIIRNLRKNFENVNIIVPFWAKSAATLLSLGGSNIIMDEFGEFGPLDMQLEKDDSDLPGTKTQSALIDEHSLNRIERRAQELYDSMLINSLNNKNLKIGRSKISQQLLDYLTNFYKPLLSKIDPYEIGSNKRFLEISEKYAERILLFFNKIEENDMRTLIDYLVNECPDHGYVIDYDLIHLFLPNVIKSEEINLEYKNKLTELSILFFKNTLELNYIGFVEPEISTNPNSQIKSDNSVLLNRQEL